jgi:hypothetical protein
MMQKHARSRVTHDYFGFLFHFRFVTVNKAFPAGALFFLERAFVKPQSSILHKFVAFRAEFSMGFVVRFAVDMNH